MKKQFSDVIIAILSVKTQLYKKFNNDEQLSEILNFLMSQDFYGDYDLKIPSIKSISEATDINYYQVRKRLLELYDSIFEEDGYVFLEFNEVEYIFIAREGKKGKSFKFKNLNFAPQVGNNLTLPFLKAEFGSVSFYVESIHSEFQNNKQTVYLFLTPGYFNKYWQIRKAEAKIKDEFSFEELCSLSDYEMQHKLGIH